MRCSSALVLSTLAVGQAAAANINRHASFHARRHAMEERNANYENVDWKKVSYDLSGVDWNSVFGKKTTSTPTPTPTPTPTSSKKEDAQTQAKATTPAYTPAAATAAAKASVNSAEKISDVLNLSAWVKGVDSFFSSIGAGCKANTPQDSSVNGAMWLGDDSQWKATFINDGSDDIRLLCWTEPNAYISTGQPEIVISLPAGSQQTVSFANTTQGISGACAPAYKHTKMSHAGQLSQAWLEFTFKEVYGTFDMSYEVYAKGDAYTAKGSQCTANKDQCAFYCKDSSADYCGIKADDYHLVNCGAAVGGGTGWAPTDGGASGGCNMGHSSEHIMVTFN